jgi:hypothetical protein
VRCSPFLFLIAWSAAAFARADFLLVPESATVAAAWEGRGGRYTHASSEQLTTTLIECLFRNLKPMRSRKNCVAANSIAAS